MIARILDGSREGSSRQVSAATRVAQVATALSAHAGADGRALRPKLATLARLVDFGWHGGFPDSPFTPVDATAVPLGAAMVADFLDLQRARGFVEGAVHAAPSALSDLKFLTSHMGLDINYSDLKNSGSVLAAASPSIEPGAEVPEPEHGGAIPLRLQAGREAAAAQGYEHSDELTQAQWAYCCIACINWLFGLRGKECRSACLEAEDDMTFIKISFHPKGAAGKPRVTAWRRAFGVLGPFHWWPGFYELFRARRSLHPAIDTGSILTARSLRPGMAPSSNSIAKDLFRLPVFGISLAAVERLRLRGHSDHGTANDVIRLFGSALGFDVRADTLVAGHWRHGSSSGGAGGVGSISRERAAQLQREGNADARLLAMPGQVYGVDDTRRHEGSLLLFRVAYIAFRALMQSGVAWDAIDPDDGWHLALRQAMIAKYQGRLWPVPLDGDGRLSAAPFRWFPNTNRHTPTPPHSPASSAAAAGDADGAFGTPGELSLVSLLQAPADAPADDGTAALLHFARSLDESTTVVP